MAPDTAKDRAGPPAGPPAARLTRRRALAGGLAAAAALAAPARVGAMAPRRAADPAALLAVLAEARGGETVLLAPGRWGRLAANPALALGSGYAAPVTLAPADPGDPPELSEIDLRGAANLVLEGLHMRHRAAVGEPLSLRPFHFVGCRALTIRGCLIEGDVARGRSPEEDGLPTGIGLSLRAPRDVVVEDSRITRFFRGLVSDRGTGLAVRRNRLWHLRMDGMNFAQATGITIADNLIRDFRRSTLTTDHADMIQFWTNGTEAPSRGITIRGNVLMSGDGGQTHSIFMRNELVDRGMAGEEMFYRDVTIAENVIVNGHTHGIALGAALGAVIRDNTLLRNQAAAQGAERTRQLRIPRIRVAETAGRVQVTGNVVAAVPAAGPGWRVEDNLIVQDLSRTAPGFYTTVFADPVAGDQGRLESFVYRAGGPADRPGFGTPLLRPGAAAARARFAP